MIIEYEFYPKHLGREFLTVYKQIKDERIEAKHNSNKTKNETLKLALMVDEQMKFMRMELVKAKILVIGQSNEHNFCYSPETVMKVRINGQPFITYVS